MNQAKYSKALSRLVAAGAIGASFTMALISTSQAQSIAAGGQAVSEAQDKALEQQASIIGQRSLARPSLGEIRRIAVDVADGMAPQLFTDDNWKDAFNNVHDKSDSPS